MQVAYHAAGEAAAPWLGVLARARVCVDNYLESAVTGRHVRLRWKTIRDRVEEKESARGGGHRAAESSNSGLISRAGLEVNRLAAD